MIYKVLWLCLALQPVILSENLFDNVFIREVQPLPSSETSIVTSKSETETTFTNLDNNDQNDQNNFIIIIGSSTASAILLFSVLGFIYVRMKNKRDLKKLVNVQNNPVVAQDPIDSPSSPTISTNLSFQLTNPDLRTKTAGTHTLATKKPANYPIAVPAQSLINDITKEFQLGAQIAVGGMAKILQVDHCNLERLNGWKDEGIIDHRNIVVKQITKDLGKELDAFKFEVAVMHSVQQFTENSVKLLAWSESPPTIVMKRYECSLDKILFNRGENKDFLPLTTIKQILLDISDALSVLEQLGVIHNDLKPHNILINTEENQIKCFLNDYGCAQLFLDRKLLRGGLKKAVEGLTPYYTAPELLLAKIQESKVYVGFDSEKTDIVKKLQDVLKKSGNKSDVYSFGIIAFEILFQQRAWKSTVFMGKMLELVLGGSRPEASDEKVEYYKVENAQLYFFLYSDIIQNCWQHEPHMRPSFAVINSLLLNHE